MSVEDEFASFYDKDVPRDSRPEYVWVITEDCLEPRVDMPEEGHRDEIGIAGPSGITSEAILYALRNGSYFEIRDDDQIPYYRGYLAALPPKKVEELDGFEPLDDFGRGNAGTTEIRFAKTAAKEVSGEWQDNPEITWETL